MREKQSEIPLRPALNNMLGIYHPEVEELRSPLAGYSLSSFLCAWGNFLSKCLKSHVLSSLWLRHSLQSPTKQGQRKELVPLYETAPPQPMPQHGSPGPAEGQAVVLTG